MKKNIMSWLIFLIMVTTIASPLIKPTLFENISPLSLKDINGNLPKNNLDQKTIKLAVIHSKPDRNINVSIKELFIDEYTALRENIVKNISLTNASKQPFENILKMLKEINLLNNNMKLDDILGDKTSVVHNSTEYNVSIMEPFLAHFSPIIIVGMGFGVGIGDKFGAISGLLYSFGVIGLGGLLCIDALAKTIYVQFTFTFPLLLHVLSSFIGIMMFPVKFDFLAASGLPIFIYSNFIAIGYSALSIGIPIGY